MKLYKIVLLVLVCIECTAFAQGDQTSRNDWYLKSPRTYLIDFQIPDPLDQGIEGTPDFFENFDAEVMLKKVKNANATGILVHTKDHEGNAYYNTQVGHKHSNCGERDFIAEFCEWGRKLDLNIIFYYSVCWEYRAWEENPEFRAVDASGAPVFVSLNDLPDLMNKFNRYVVCMNGPYRDYMKKMLVELTENYDFDGYWLDVTVQWPKVNPCYCDYCKADYKNQTGKEIPNPLKNDEEGRAYQRWRFALNTAIMDEMIETVHKVNPRITVTSNGANYNSVLGWDYCDQQDYLCHEYHSPEGPAGPSFYSLKNNAIKPGVPSEIEIWRHSYYAREGHSRTSQVRNIPVLYTEMAGVVAQGNFPQYYDQITFDGRLGEESLELIGPVFEMVSERQQWGGVGKRIPYAQLLWSKNSDYWAGGKASRMHYNALKGAHLACVESHIPVGMVAERDIEKGLTYGAEVIVVPEAECLSDECIAGLTDFVKNGGGLVVTHRSSIRNEEGILRDNFGLSELMGVDYVDMTNYIYGYYQLDKEHPVTERNLKLNFPMNVHETKQAIIKPHDGTDVLGSIVSPIPGFKIDMMPHKKTDFPVLAVRNFGKGRIVYCSAALAFMYEQYSHLDQRNLLVNAMEWAAGSPPPVTAETHETVEVIPWYDAEGKRTIVHLVNRTGAGLAQGRGSLQHEIIPVHDIKLKINKTYAGKTAVAQPGERKLEVKQEGDWMIVNVDKMDAWEIIEIR